jgi:hypothetical protein
MEQEMNYLSEKIEEVDRSISGCSFAVEIEVSTDEELQELKIELQMLNNILNKLTELELSNTP